LLAACGVASAVTIWAVYGFQYDHSRALGVAVPAAAFIDGLRAINNRVSEGNAAFLMGNYSSDGWWYYFPVVFAVKTPLPLLILFAMSLIYCWRKRGWRKAIVPLMLSAIYFCLSMLSSLNIGYRHLLCILPFLFLFISQLAAIQWRQRMKLAWIPALLVAWLAAGTLLIFPNYLTYFNELVGGTRGGYKVLADSNIDWGQDLPAVREYMTRENIPSIKLSYFGSARPEFYGITYEPLPSFPRHFGVTPGLLKALEHPAPGVYVISVTNLQGVLFPVHSVYSWFRQYEPDAVIGNSMFVYRVSSQSDSSTGS